MKKTNKDLSTEKTTPTEALSDGAIKEPKVGYIESELQPPLFPEVAPLSIPPGIYHYSDQIIQGDCGEILKSIPDNSIDLIVTSPPYADQRSSTYGGIKPEQYVSWFIPKADQFLRALKPTGTFILNIKERVVDGERSTYVMELVIEMRRHGWLWTEEYLWHKKNSYPGKWSNRFRDNWEHLFQFNKSKKFKMFQDEVKVPVGDWAQDRLKNLSATDKRRDNSRVGSGFGKKISNWVGREMVYPSNVLYMATECYNRQHSATFPISLPQWFIKLFTEEGDLVLDPFNGSGTTCVAARRLHRHYLGIDTNEEFCRIAIDRIENDK
ncbi:MAG: site-specific DNA-methyltransferase, partial [Anaerolineaceae bacterium]|nr:site-specific DNA-methyltransferase [Anaerolineaceae bacterium]